MNGELAQLIAIVSYGNLFLRTGDSRIIRALLHSSRFQHVGSLEFSRHSDTKDEKGKTVADGLGAWLELLRNERASRLWNVAFAAESSAHPEHRNCAFANGVPRAIQADLQDAFELWYPQWLVTEASPKRWSVRYRALRFPESSVPSKISPEFARSQLVAALQDAWKFCHRFGTTRDTWKKHFEDAVTALESPDPVIPYYADMLPPNGYSLAARQLVAAASAAWVFGGMGSWNDLEVAPELQAESDAITRQLYEAVKLSLVIGSNSFEP